MSDQAENARLEKQAKQRAADEKLRNEHKFAERLMEHDSSAATAALCAIIPSI